MMTEKQKVITWVVGGLIAGILFWSKFLYHVNQNLGLGVEPLYRVDVFAGLILPVLIIGACAYITLRTPKKD